MRRINYADSHQVVYRSLDVQEVAPWKGLKRNEIRYVGPAPALVICICMRPQCMATPSLHRALCPHKGYRETCPRECKRKG